uniref:HIRAN domain-containing protein n=1 Tax=Amphimedon queenslandica TaxID=400682 RepID=A0A1X7T090_AMPQE
MYAVSVIKDGVVVGHLPKKISRLCSLFIRRGGIITCRPTGRQRHSSDLPQGGLEIPCLLIFDGEAQEIKKLIKLSTDLSLF